jgi:ankyrin repeat protein
MDPEPVDLTQQLQAVSLEGKPDLDAELEALYDQLNEARPVANHNGRARAALYAAAAAGRLQEVQQLLAAGANVNAHTRGGSTPLHAAARGNHSALVTALLEAGASRTSKDSTRSTPSHVAASSGATAAMTALMAPGIDLCAYDADGSTPLHLACIKGWAEAARVLVDSGAPVDQKRSHRYQLQADGTAQLTSSGDGSTPLHAACKRGRLDMVRLLLAAGAGVNLKTKMGWSPLFLACQRGHTHLIDALVAAGASSSVLDEYGWGPLHAAAHRGHPQVVQRLLQLPAAVVDPPSKRGVTPLYVACDEGHSEVAGLLVAAGAHLNRPAMNGWTPFHVAISRKRTELVQQLMGVGGDPGAAGGNGQNSLHVAAAVGHLPTLQVLLAAAAAGQGTAFGINDQAQGMTALQRAVEGQHLGCVEVLLAAGADRNKLFGEGAVTGDKKSIAGASILHRAVQKGFAAAVPLLATPANLSHVWNGQTPLQLAMATGTGTKEEAAVASALLALGALPDQDRVSLMSRALTSNKEALKGLLPAMVRGECLLYQQQQQVLQDGGQGQGGHQPDLAAVLECVRASAEQRSPQLAAACISAVMDVLGAPAAGSLVQELLKKCFAAGGEAAAGGITSTQLVAVLHQGWLDALKPTRGRNMVSRRLRRLVVKPLERVLDMHWQQQHDEGGAAAAPAAGGATAAGAHAGRGPHWSAELYSKGAAVATAGQWGPFVAILEQLLPVGRRNGEYSSKQLLKAAEAHVRGSWAGVAGLCEALLVAWWEARPGVTARAQGEVREAVVAGVEAWHQLQLQQQWVVGDNKRR